MADLFTEQDIQYVSDKYSEETFDPERAISQFHNNTGKSPGFRRIIIAAAACIVPLVAVTAASYGIYRHSHTDRQPSEISAPASPSPHTDNAEERTFTYDNAPLTTVLEELSSYLGCTLVCAADDKYLTATFSNEDIELIISCIESVLDVKITIEK